MHRRNANINDILGYVVAIYELMHDKILELLV